MFSRYKPWTCNSWSNWSSKTTIWYMGQYSKCGQQDGQHWCLRQNTGKSWFCASELSPKMAEWPQVWFTDSYMRNWQQQLWKVMLTITLPSLHLHSLSGCRKVGKVGSTLMKISSWSWGKCYMRKNIVPSSIYLSTSSLLATLGTEVVTPDLIIDVSD